MIPVGNDLIFRVATVDFYIDFLYDFLQIIYSCSRLRAALYLHIRCTEACLRQMYMYARTAVCRAAGEVCAFARLEYAEIL